MAETEEERQRRLLKDLRETFQRDERNRRLMMVKILNLGTKIKLLRLDSAPCTFGANSTIMLRNKLCLEIKYAELEIESLRRSYRQSLERVSEHGPLRDLDDLISAEKESAVDWHRALAERSEYQTFVEDYKLFQ